MVHHRSLLVALYFLLVAELISWFERTLGNAAVGFARTLVFPIKHFSRGSWRERGRTITGPACVNNAATVIILYAV